MITHALQRRAVGIVLAFTSLAFASEPPRQITREDHLHTRAEQIVDRTGKPIQLCGVNIGGWLVTEAWMCGQTDEDGMNGRGALEVLERRFGEQKAADLMDVWYDNWFTTRDVDLIQSWGFNLIRVPFGYRNLQDATGNWRRDARGEIDFSRMDWVVKQASERGMYVVFDLHIWPRQFEKDNYGLPSRWSDEGKIVRTQMASLWREVARHFRGDGRIAAFDVINEPEGSPWNAPHHAFVDAIRGEDPDRMVIVEWSGYENTPKEFPVNAVYSDHYSFKDKDTLGKWMNSLEAHPEVHVPIFLGEMKPGTDTVEGARWLADTMNDHGWHWSIWCYKAVSMGGWAAFNYDSDLRYDLSRDSYESLRERWGRELTAWQVPGAPRNSYLTDWWVEGFRQQGRKIMSLPVTQAQ